MEKKKRNRESTYPRSCKSCGVLLQSRSQKNRHVCKIDPVIKPEDIIFERLRNSNYMEAFKKLKCDIKHDENANHYIESYKEDSIIIVANGIVEDTKLITLDALFADIPEILADGAYIKVDIHTNTLYYVPCNERTESVFQAMIKNDDMEITKILEL
jgi:hypothetical protein